MSSDAITVLAKFAAASSLEKEGAFGVQLLSKMIPKSRLGRALGVGGLLAGAGAGHAGIDYLQSLNPKTVGNYQANTYGQAWLDAMKNNPAQVKNVAPKGAIAPEFKIAPGTGSMAVPRRSWGQFFMDPFTSSKAWQHDKIYPHQPEAQDFRRQVPITGNQQGELLPTGQRANITGQFQEGTMPGTSPLNEAQRYQLELAGRKGGTPGIEDQMIQDAYDQAIEDIARQAARSTGGALDNANVNQRRTIAALEQARARASQNFQRQGLDPSVLHQAPEIHQYPEANQLLQALKRYSAGESLVPEPEGPTQPPNPLEGLSPQERRQIGRWLRNTPLIGWMFGGGGGGSEQEKRRNHRNRGRRGNPMGANLPPMSDDERRLDMLRASRYWSRI